MAFEASVANNQRYEDVNVTFPIEVSDPNVRQDVHSVSSLLKLYFRELPGLFVIFLITKIMTIAFLAFSFNFWPYFRPSVHLQIVRRIFGGCQSSGRFETECNETSSQSFIKGTFQVNYFLKFRYS